MPIVVQNYEELSAKARKKPGHLSWPGRNENPGRFTSATRKLFQRGTEIAAKQGLILVDTKYEFGKIGDQIVLMDEIHTPDSSRYFIADQYEERFAKGEPQVQLSKEFVREWLMANGFQGKEGQKVPEMTPEYVESVSERYIELYEKVTGHKFEKAPDSEDLAKRIETNVMKYLMH